MDILLFTSRFSKQAYDKSRMAEFRSIIGFDQFLHNLHLILLLWLIS